VSFIYKPVFYTLSEGANSQEFIIILHPLSYLEERKTYTVFMPFGHFSISSWIFCSGFLFILFSSLSFNCV